MVIEPKQQDCMVGMENTLDQTLAYWQQMIENSYSGRRKLYLLYFSGFCVSCTGLCCTGENILR